jgi:hypothetical protein
MSRERRCLSLSLTLTRDRTHMAKQHRLPTLQRVQDVAQALAEKVEAVPPPERTPPPAEGQTKRCRVDLAHSPSWEGTALSEEDAIAQMKAEYGIRESDHPFFVVWLEV